MKITDTDIVRRLSLMVRPGEVILVATGDEVVKIQTDGRSFRHAMRKLIRSERKSKMKGSA